MYLKDVISKSVRGLPAGAITLSALQLTLGSAWASPFQSAEDPATRTPIKHVIVIIGENRTFDHVFATYKPKTGETVGGTGQTSGTPDKRIPNVNDLRPGPFQLTSPTFPYDAYAASPVHRFYQMWQQLDCNVYYATERNPSGCKSDLFPWVEVTIGAGSNGKPQAKPFTDETTGEGSTSMGFYNVLNGDAPYFKELADTYAMSDNYHQAVMGGTGANHIMLGTGDAIFFSDSNGSPAVPPHNQLVASGSPNAGVVDEVENPNAALGTNNWYTEDGYGGGSYGKPSYGGGSYSDCSDSNQPGVTSVLNHLSSLPRPINPNCAPGRYYLLNNYNPGYFGDGTNAYADISNGNNTVFTIPPSNVRNIGDSLLVSHISFAYYGDQFNLYKNDPYDLNPLVS